MSEKMETKEIEIEGAKKLFVKMMFLKKIILEAKLKMIMAEI